MNSGVSSLSNVFSSLEKPPRPTYDNISDQRAAVRQEMWRIYECMEALRTSVRLHCCALANRIHVVTQGADRKGGLKSLDRTLGSGGMYRECMGKSVDK